jgi:hypothetical protein
LTWIGDRTPNAGRGPAVAGFLWLLLLGEIHGVRENPLLGPQGKTRLHQHEGELVLDLPIATEAVVPQRPYP